MVTIPAIRMESRFAWPLVLVAGCLFIIGFPEVIVPGYYYYDDSMHLFLPTMHEIGWKLRQLQLPFVSDRTWFGGNFMGEGQFALLNPLSLSLYVAMSSIADTAVAAMLFAGTHLMLLSGAVYLLVLRLGGLRPYAAVAALGWASSNIVSYWYASEWWNALAADTWLVVSLAAWALYLKQGRGLVVAVVTGAISLASGWPHGWIALYVFIGAFAVAAVIAQDIRRAATIIAAAALMLLLASPALVPTIVNSLFSERKSRLANNAELVGSLEALVSVAWPSFVTPVTRFFNQYAEFPVYYAGWFVLPMLVFGARPMWLRAERPISWLLVMLIGAAAALSLSPEQVGMMRWPFRFLSYFNMGVLVASALAAAYMPERLSRRQLALMLGLWVVSLFFCWAHEPGSFAIHLRFLAVTGIFAFVVFAARAGLSHDVKGGILVASILTVFAMTHGTWLRNLNVLHQWPGPRQVDTRGESFEPLPASPGNILLLYRGDIPTRGTASPLLPSGALMFWEKGRFINGYSSTPSRGLTSTFLFNFWGWTGLSEFSPLFAVDAETGRRLDELMDIREIRVRKGRLLRKLATQIPPEWKVVDEDAECVVYVNERWRPSRSGTAIWASSGLDMREISYAPALERIAVSNPAAEPARIVFARSLYPGYSIKLNGASLPLDVRNGFLVSTTLPPGAEGVLEVAVEPPYWRWTATVATLSLVLLIALTRLSRGGER